jgi:hypothetical protein
VKKRDVEKGIAKLRPEVREGDHRFFNVFCDQKHMVGWTKVSRLADNDDLGPDLQSAIPRQLGIPKSLFGDICGCTKARSEYLEAVGHSH